jgi:hypothetical protein
MTAAFDTISAVLSRALLDATASRDEDGPPADGRQPGRRFRLAEPVQQRVRVAFQLGDRRGGADREVAAPGSRARLDRR